MIAQELEVSLHMAFVNARLKRHEYIGVEHLLLALLDNPSASQVLQACGADIPSLKKQLSAFTEQNTPIIPADKKMETQPTLGFQRVIQRAILHIQSSEKKEVQGENILAALFAEQDSHAVYFLKEQGITREQVIHYIDHQSPQNNEQSTQRSNAHEPEHKEGQADNAYANVDPLLEYTINLNHLAKTGKIDPLIGREAELERMIQTLCRRRKNNPLLIGEAGVGKTAIVEGLAQRIVSGMVPPILENVTIYSLDMGKLIAGTKYRGDFEQRLKILVEQLENMARTAILFIDEIHMLIGAGAASGGNTDASNLIKPALSNGQIQCIGATTYQEYRAIFEKDSALSRRFQKLDVPEPSIEDTIQILKGLKSRFEAFHNIKYTQAAINAAVHLSARYLNDRFFPDKAIDVIDEAGAAQNILPLARRKKTIGKHDIEDTIAKIARVPARNVSQSDLMLLQKLDTDLRRVVFGQNKAIDTLAGAIKMSRSGLGNPLKPTGSFLFSGPTGVGKTEVARQLAFILGVELIRFDMSEYMEKHAVSRLIGAPPGYVGYEQGGQLTEAVNKHPYAVLLLDEVEKAHPDIFNIMLQVMDHGTLTDNDGRKSDFRNVIIIMTTNAGAEQLSKHNLGFMNHRMEGDEMTDINRLFSPEFRNRLDAIISFQPLDEQTILQVVDKFLLQLEQQLADKRVEVHYTDALRRHLAQKGFDPLMGARPMARLIQDTIRKRLADELLFGRLSHGGEVMIDMDDEDEIVLVFSTSATSNPPVALEA